MDLYNTLGVPPSATVEEIKRKYRQIARELHPDVNPDPAAHERFKQVTYAYDVLSDPQKRQSYDMAGPAMNRPGAESGTASFDDQVDQFLFDLLNRTYFQTAPQPFWKRFFHRSRPQSNGSYTGTGFTAEDMARARANADERQERLMREADERMQRLTRDAAKRQERMAKDRERLMRDAAKRQERLMREADERMQRLTRDAAKRQERMAKDRERLRRQYR